MGRFPFSGNDKEGNCNVSANIAMGHKYISIKKEILQLMACFYCCSNGFLFIFFCFVDMALLTWKQQGHDDDCL